MKINLSYEAFKEAHAQSMEAHKHSQKHYITNIKKHGTVSSSSSSSSPLGAVIFAFPGFWDVKDWYKDELFGEIDVVRTMFPSLRRISQDKPAKVNAAFFARFQKLLEESQFQIKVEEAVKDEKKILLTGHSSGGAIACFATLWILERYTRKQESQTPISCVQESQTPISCVTFGCPLVGDRVLSHALRRQKWADHFTHFVTELDVIPRMMLAPHSSIEEQLPHILSFFQQKVNTVKPNDHKPFKISNPFTKSSRKRTNADLENDLDQSIKDHQVAFFEKVLMSASAVASHDAYDLMEPTGYLLEKLMVDFVKVSPYRPFGTYIFCTRNKDQDPETARPQLVVENPHAVLQLLFYFCQLSSEDESLVEFARNSLDSNLGYEEELNKNGFQKWVNLKDLNDHLVTPNGTPSVDVCTINKSLSEVSTKGRLCLVAVEEAEKRKKENEKRIDKTMNTDPKNTKGLLREIRRYKERHAEGELGYYDAFKLQDNRMDFESNINRLELMKIWDEIVEMVIRENLPDEFEGREDWVDLGTEFRRLVEPLDVANYYRHLKGKSYLEVRPKRYKFTQKWYEHAKGVEFGEISESNFLAEVEQLKKDGEGPMKKEFDEVKARVLSLEEQVLKWVNEKILENDVFLKESTLSKWWRGLPDDHKTGSVLGNHVVTP